MSRICKYACKISVDMAKNFVEPQIREEVLCKEGEEAKWV